MRVALQLLVGFVVAVAMTNVSAAFPIDQSLGDVFLGDSEQEVVTKLGPPVRRTAPDGAYHKTLSYPGFVVSFVEDSVDAVTSGNAERCTASNACPGGGLDSALDNLGEPASIILKADATRITIYRDQSDCWLALRSKLQVIQAIELQCAM